MTEAAILAAAIANDIPKARDLFRAAMTSYSFDDLAMMLAAATEPGDGVITLGEAPLVMGNPCREGFVWRCGTCLHAWRRGRGLPAAGVNYKTLNGARKAADRHSAERHRGAVPVEEAAR